MKWNMGWMNDSLRYFARDPIHRRWHHDELTFGQMYAYSENFVLPLSHDEVVHGKGSLLGKMPGDAWQRHANLRLLLAWQALTPGKKLMFMGGEFGQQREWSEARELDWPLLANPANAALQHLSADLNRLYRDLPALHSQDFTSLGFEWIDCHDSEHSILSWLRWGKDGSFVVVVFNFTPVPQTAYRLGVPEAGTYVELLNTDSAYYGGSNLGNGGTLPAVAGEWMGRPANLCVTIPPLGAVVLRLG
jgi:1,4-alpha-glucan branching enzyme